MAIQQREDLVLRAHSLMQQRSPSVTKLMSPPKLQKVSSRIFACLNAEEKEIIVAYFIYGESAYDIGRSRRMPKEMVNELLSGAIHKIGEQNSLLDTLHSLLAAEWVH